MASPPPRSLLTPARLHRSCGVLLAVCLLALTAGDAAAQPALSPRNASYEIDVTLDVEQKRLRGRQVLTWRNIQNEPASELWFHLYWNAWRNTHSTWLREDRSRGRSSRDPAETQEGDWAWLDVHRVRRLDGPEVDLSNTMRFEAPDDGNADDRTMMVVSLDEPIAPGATARVELTWEAKVPRTFARTGYHGDFFFIAHWFPKLGVFEGPGWNCHQFHAATEFFSDYGSYDVRITLPARFVVGATGRAVETADGADGTRTHRFLQDDVHGFAWTASPDYLERTDRFEVEGLPPVALRLLIQPEHLHQAERHFHATKATLERYGRWYGPYPYGQLTIVDPAFNSQAGGMEYPTLFTCGTSVLAPFGGGRPEGVTVHEAGHQLWYGVVGNNEFEHAWLDEGINTFSTARVMDEAYGPTLEVRRYLAGLVPVVYEELKKDRMVFGHRLPSYRQSPSADVPATPTYLYAPDTAYQITYFKTALWLATLERHLGWETLRRALARFYEHWRFRHPTPADLFLAIEAEAGEDLTWFFDQVYRGSAVFDYRIKSVSSAPAGVVGWVGDGQERRYVREADAQLQRTEVVVERLGDGVFPVDVLLVFDDGHEVRERWDGRDRWKRLTVEHPHPLRHAVVDPDRVLMLDVDYLNNSRLRHPQARLPAVKWAARWMVWLQDYLLAVGFFL